VYFIYLCHISIISASWYFDLKFIFCKKKCAQTIFVFFKPELYKECSFESNSENSFDVNLMHTLWFL
jgi:hypothetical protein